MELCLFLVFCCFLIVPVQLEKYDLIIIPVPKGRIHSVGHYREKRSRYRNDKDEFKLDIEKHQEPTEQPDLGYFDHNVEKSLRINDGDDKSSNRDRDESFEVYGDDKIVDGEEVDISLYPYHVAYGSNCAGAIIDEKWVMTAGHCGKKPFIRAGSKILNEGERIRVKKHFIHPMWFGSNKEHPFDFDYQLLELEKPLQFNSDIQPVKIGNMTDMEIGKHVSITGWGNTYEDGPYSRVLRAVRLPIIAMETCNRVRFPYFRGSLTPRMFCAGFAEGNKDACQGDSGGPAVSNDRLLGIISFGYGCATPGAYGVYSKVAKVRDWIAHVTRITLE